MKAARHLFKSTTLPAFTAVGMMAATPLAAAIDDTWLPDEFDEGGALIWSDPLVYVGGAILVGGTFALLAGGSSEPFSP